MSKGFGALLLLVVITILLIALISAVGFIGYYFGKTSNSAQYRTATTQTPILSIDPIPIDETVNWQEYKDSKNNLYFKYPNTWKLEDRRGEDVHFTTERQTSKKGTGDYTPGVGWMDLRVSTKSLDQEAEDTPGNTREKLTISGYEAIKVSGYTGIASSVFFQAVLISVKNQTYVFSMGTQDEDLKTQFTEEFEQIIKTFKFD